MSSPTAARRSPAATDARARSTWWVIGSTESGADGVCGVRAVGSDLAMRRARAAPRNVPRAPGEDGRVGHEAMLSAAGPPFPRTRCAAHRATAPPPSRAASLAAFLPSPVPPPFASTSAAPAPNSTCSGSVPSSACAMVRCFSRPSSLRVFTLAQASSYFSASFSWLPPFRCASSSGASSTAFISANTSSLFPAILFVWLCVSHRC